MRPYARILLLTLFALSGGTRSFADARGDAEYARNRLDVAEACLRQVQCDLAAAQAALNDALCRRDGAVSAISSANATAIAAAANLGDAQARIAGVLQDAKTFADRSAERGAAFDVAKKQADEAAAEVAKYRDSAIAEFESSPAFKARAEAFASAQKAVTDQTQIVLDRLATTLAYADLYREVEETEARVRKERTRDAIDYQSLSAASMLWIDAKNALERLKAEAVAADANVALAKTHLDFATRDRDALVARFNGDLAKDSTLAKLNASAANAATVASAIAAEANAADTQRASAETEANRLQTVIAYEQARLNQAQRDAASYASNVNGYAWEVNRWQNAVSRLCRAQQSAANDRDYAARNLRFVIEQANGDWQRDQLARRDVPRGGFVHVTRDEPRHDENPLRDRGDRYAQANDNRNQDRDHERNEEENRASADKDRAERERIAAEGAAKRAEEDRLLRLSKDQADRERKLAREEEIRRAQEKQRSEEKRDREEQQRQQQDAKLASDKQQADASARDERKRQEQEKRDAQANSERDKTARQQAEQERAEREKANREGQARREEERRAEQARAQQARAEQDGEAKSRDDKNRAEQEKRDAQARESQARDAQARADEKRRESDDRRRADEEKSRKDSEQRDRDRDTKFRGK